ncbi:MAG: DUF6677 family protein [Phycisphaerae bacterium]
MTSATEDNGSGAIGYVALVAGWFIPGLGHWLIGRKKHAKIFALGIHGLFFMGLLLGGLPALNRPRQRLWDYAQYLAGWPAVVGDMAKTHYYPPKSHHPPGFAPLIQEVATAYCGLAGMLNLLVLVDLFMHISDPVPDVSPPRSVAPGET